MKSDTTTTVLNFVLLMLAFLVLGIFVMADQSSAIGQMVSNPSGENSSNVLGYFWTMWTR